MTHFRTVLLHIISKTDKAIACPIYSSSSIRNIHNPNIKRAMISVQPSNKTFLQSTCLWTSSKLPSSNLTRPETTSSSGLIVRLCQGNRRKLKCRSGNGLEGENKSERRSFLTLEEAGLVEISGLSTHERFLCRLTISSLNLLRVISEQEGCSIEELNAGRVCDWFLKDKLKREQNIESAVLQWDDPEFHF